MTANTPATKKAKGSAYERRVAKMYKKYGLFPNAKRMPGSGAFEGLKGDILKLDENNYPVYDTFNDECKCQEQVRLAQFWKQTVAQQGKAYPVLHITSNHRPSYSIVRHEDFEDIIWEKSDQEQDWPHEMYLFEGRSFWDATEILTEHIVTIKPGVPVVLMPKEYDNLLLMATEQYMDFRVFERGEW